jgi:hypothetical protein
MNRYGLFCCGQLNYAVALESLKVLLQEQPICKLPLTSGQFISILIVDHVAVPLLVFNRSVVAGRHEEKAAGFQAVLESEHGPIALLADTPGRVTGKGECLPAEADDPPWISGKYRYKSAVYAILNIDGLAMEMAGHLGSRSMPRG